MEKARHSLDAIISEGQCYVSNKELQNIHLSNASLWQMRVGTRYKLPSGTEPEACPCLVTHKGLSQPRSRFSRISGAEKETQTYRTDFWTLWEKVRVGCFKRTASKHVYYLG